MVLLEPTAAGAPFSQRVQRCFGRSAAAYPSQARLQAAVAERLARWLTRLTPAPPAGIRADLGAGSGLLARAIERRLGGRRCCGWTAARNCCSRRPLQRHPNGSGT